MINSVAGLIKEDNRYFLAKRDHNGVMADKWEIPGGKCELGESLEEALIREFKEELNLDIKVGDFLGSSQFSHHNEVYKLNLFEVIFDLKAPITLSVHTQWKWFKKEEIFQLDLVPSDRLILEKIHL